MSSSKKSSVVIPTRKKILFDFYRKVPPSVPHNYLFRKSHPELKVKVYALLDDASDTTFIKTDVKYKLGIPGVNSKLILSTMLGSEEITVCRVDGLVVERIDQRVQVELPRTYSRDQIPSRRDQIPSPEVAAVWPHLQKIKNKIMPYQESLEIGFANWLQLSEGDQAQISYFG